jgi:hypothetical protein
MLPLPIYHRIPNINTTFSESEATIAQARILLASLTPYQNCLYIGLQRIVFTDQSFHKNVPGEDEGEKKKREERRSKKVKKEKGKRK